MESQIALSVERSLAEFVEAALTRLRYLHADVNWSFDRDTHQVLATGDLDHRTEGLQKDLNYQIYREKILLETGAIRRRLYEAL